MKINKSTLLTTLSIALTTGALWASPLFPDVPDQHWAQDAVASLAAKGLVEGYPDGTFKGDRATTRWEVAMIVARLLQKEESAHATFSSKQEREEILKLAEALRNELDALGVRVSDLEENVSLLDQRVTELERITFYGSVDTRVVFQSFSNNGAVDNDAGRLGNGNPGGVPYINYNNIVGAGAGAPLRPQIVGFIPPVDYRLGKALTNGTGFSTRAILGMRMKVSQDIDAGLEFAAYSSQGDSVIDAYWGVSAPYLSNPFTANASHPNTPYTNMTLNQFWLEHKPSHTKVVLGNVDHTEMDSMVYAGQGNLGVYGPRRWPGYGFDVSGEAGDFKWEVLGTRFGNGVRFQGTNYDNYVLSGNLRYHYKNGEIGVFGSRMSEEAPNGTNLVVGIDNGLNVRYGASTGWNVRQWVNPPGYYVGQVPPIGNVFPNTDDKRPVSGWNPTQDNAVGFGAGAGDFGPQSQDIFGVNIDHMFKFDDKNSLKVDARWAGSDYRPNRNSGYNAKGMAMDLDLDARLLDGNLNLRGDLLRVDPDYAPAAWFGNVLGGRPVKPFNFTGVFHLYDSGKYPHNRTGVRLRGNWKFDEGAGKVWAKGSILQQTQTSLYDVRVTGGALGAAIPTNDVIGFAPGFVDTAFAGFAHPNIYGTNSQNSFTANLTPLENPRGKERLWEVGASYRWNDPGVTLSGSFTKNHLFRHSGLTAAQGGSQNEVDVDVDSALVEAAWDATSKWTVLGGFDWIHAKGHFDPAGLYNGVALATNNTTFDNIDSTQWIPHLGFDYGMTENTNWGLMARHYSTDDGVDNAVQAGNSALGQIGSTSHPFNWSGWQVSSEFQMSF